MSQTADAVATGPRSKDQSKARWVSLLGRLASVADRLLATWWVSYLLIAALQLKIIWGSWQYRDLTSGDTSYYFVTAFRWAESLVDNIVWSPLYTSFYGTLFKITGDAYAATIAHRFVIVMLAAIGVLALMRQLLPPVLALLIAVWWVVLPINFDTLYEVHLFALLPILAAWLVAARFDNPAGRGVVLAILAGSAVLVRNELSVAATIFGLVCLGREAWAVRHASDRWSAARHRIVAYIIPLVVAGLLGGFFFVQSEIKGAQLAEVAHIKHAQNMCQVYAFGYSQRHPEWTQSPWTECAALAKATFGEGWPTLGQMLRNNPAAVADHFLWNLGLTPAGLQLALFNGTFGTVNPDYVPVAHKGSIVIGVASVILLAILVAGLWRFSRAPRFWWEAWFRKRQGVWLAMLSVAIVAAPVILVQRPRPSYLFALTCVIMALVGSALLILIRKRTRLTALTALVFCVLLILFVPSFYVAHPSPRPLYKAYEALKPSASIVGALPGKVILGDLADDLGNYATPGRHGYLYYDTLKQMRPGQTLAQFLDEQQINGFYVQARIYPEIVAQTPGGGALLANPESLGWTRVTAGNDPAPALFVRKR